MNDYFTLDEKQKNTLRGIFDEEDARRSPYATPDRAAVRRFRYRNDPNGLRTGFGIDIDKILNHPYYSHYADKTQVFSFQNNDEISRRSLHVQLVSRIARIIGRALQLNLELIEAIALGHDIGHTPFGHKGEDFLNELYNAKTGRHFKHNVHSVRVLKELSATAAKKRSTNTARGSWQVSRNWTDCSSSVMSIRPSWTLCAPLRSRAAWCGSAT